MNQDDEQKEYLRRVMLMSPAARVAELKRLKWEHRIRLWTLIVQTICGGLLGGLIGFCAGPGTN